MLRRLFIRSLGTMSPPAQSVSEAARTLSAARRPEDRTRVIDLANEMRARMGMSGMIPRRPQ